MTAKAVHIGTSGWQYDHWLGPFYPQDIAKQELLEYYSRHFQTVEVNNSFYQLPTEKTLQQWRETTPPDFTFSVKASRYITHMKKLKDSHEPVSNFLERVKILGDKLGPILFQLPPNWNFNAGRLDDFLSKLPDGYRYALELRDPGWLNEQAYEMLRRYGAAFCIYDFDGRLSPKEVTADFVYIRLHGPDGAYQGRYDAQALSGWAGAMHTWLDQGKDIYCYFDNDEQGFAVQNALKLQEMVHKAVR